MRSGGGAQPKSPRRCRARTARCEGNEHNQVHPLCPLDGCYAVHQLPRPSRLSCRVRQILWLLQMLMEWLLPERLRSVYWHLQQ